MKKLIVTGHYIQLSEDGKPNPALCERPDRFGHVYLAPAVDARIAELEGWLDRLLPSWREAEARDYEEALVTSYRRQIAELEADLETLARSGCKVRTFNGERYVEIASSSTD